MVDRLSIRTRPRGLPLVHQSWDKLLFMHWPVPVEQLRPLVPSRLEIDTFGGTAWIGLTPFTFWGTRPVFCPALPLLSSAHELNVRTYVHLDGVPGIWFLSLDVSNALAVVAARWKFYLPYFLARMRLRDDGEVVRFQSYRTQPGAAGAGLEAVWNWGAPLPPAEPATLAFCLVERYCLYAARGEQLYRARIFHRPWPLRQARLIHFSSTMLQSHGLVIPKSEPLVHGQAAPLHVEIWSPQQV